LSYIKEAAKNIGKVLANKEGYHLVVVKSTVVSGTTEDVVMPILEKYSGKISYWNEIYLICKELGIDSQGVANIVGFDPRIGKYGTVHGKAFGGKCLPKDLKAFISFAKKYRNVRLLKAVDDINEEMKEKYEVREWTKEERYIYRRGINNK